MNSELCPNWNTGIIACPARPGATPRWDARQRINQVWARGATCRVPLLLLVFRDRRSKLIPIKFGLGQGIKILSPKQKG